MRTKRIKQLVSSKSIQRLLISLLMVSTLFAYSAAEAQGFGVSGADANANADSNVVAGNSNAQKINALLANMQSPSNANQLAAPAATNTSEQPTTAQQAAAPSSASDNNPNSVNNQAFAMTARNMIPLSPDQIKTLHYAFDRSQQASAEYPGVPPKPTSSSLIVNLSPGAVPPTVRLRQGFITSVVFVDATGAPWPIQAFDLGNQKSFNVQWDQKGNTLLVQALGRYNSGNLAVMLKGLNTPIMVTLMPGQRAVDYRIDMRVPKMGPEANPNLAGLPQTENSSLMSVLDGVPPTGAHALIIHGADAQAQAWLLKGHIYMRTRMSILSPAYISTMSSADGTHAYEIQSTPVILALSRGQTIKMTIEGL